MGEFIRLPLGCRADFYPDFISAQESDALFDWIVAKSGVPEMRQFTMADGTVQEIETGKLMFVDQELVDHGNFHATHGRRISWPAIVVPLRDRIEEMLSREFSVCVCIYYHDGGSGVGFHADPASFGPTSIVPSISLGEEREFLIRRTHDPSDVHRIELDHGSLLIMGEGFQEEYEHSLPRDEKYRRPRINLTFRPFDWPRGFRRDVRV